MTTFCFFELKAPGNSVGLPTEQFSASTQVFYSNQKMKLETRTCAVEMGKYAKQCDIELRDISDDTVSHTEDVNDMELMMDVNAKEDRRYLLLYGIKPSDDQERRFLRFYDHVDHCEEYFGIKLGQNQKKVAILEVLCCAFNIFEGQLVEHISFLCQLFSMEMILMARDAVSIIVGRRGGKTFAQCVVAACWLVTQPGANNICFFTISKRAATDASAQIQARLANYSLNHPEANLRIITHNVEKITVRNKYMSETDTISVTCYPGLSADGKIEYMS